MNTIPTITKPVYWVELVKGGKRVYWPGVFYDSQAARGQAHVYARNIGASGYTVWCADPSTSTVTAQHFGSDLEDALKQLAKLRGDA